MDGSVAPQLSMRGLLQQEFESRKRRNASYSLRAFARDLGVDSGRLSKILKAQRPVSCELMQQFAERLGLSDQHLNDLQSYGKYDCAFKGFSSDLEMDLLGQDTFAVIQDWRHYAVLELIKLSDFKPELTYVSNKLGCSASEAGDIVSRLIAVKLLVVDESGHWVDLTEGQSTHVQGFNLTTLAHKNYQKDVLSQAMQAMDKTDISLRDQSTMMMATSPKKIALAKQLMKSFRRSLCEFLEDEEDKSAVYHLSLSLFPITEINEFEDKGDPK